MESVQLDDVFTAFKILDKTGLDNTFTKRLTQYLIDQGVHIAKETGQEVAQEMNHKAYFIILNIRLKEYDKSGTIKLKKE